MEKTRLEKDMKESGIEWVGKIPENWKIAKNNRLFTISKSLVGDMWSSTQLLSLTKSGIIEKNINDGGGKQPESFSTYQFVEKDDIVLCLFDIDVSAVFSDRSNYSGMISPAYRVMKCNDAILPSFAKWWFDAVNIGRYYLIYTKSLRKTIDSEGFGNILTAIPPKEEQKAISEYLYNQCSKIDSLINEAKISIEEYKKLKQAVIYEIVTKGIETDVEMVESGDEWLGVYPKNYNIGQLSMLSNIVRGGSPRPAGDPRYYGGDIPFMRISDITKDERIYVDSCVHTITQEGLSRTRMIPANTLLLTNSGATLGVPKINTFETTFNDGIAAFLDLDERLNIVYVYYFLKAKTSYFLECASMGMGQPNLNTDIIGRTKIVFPSMEKQSEIVDYLEEKCNKLEALIIRKHELVKDLEQYKKSLIYEVATGKRKVV